MGATSASPSICLKHGHYTADAIARRIRDLLGSMKALAAAVDICCSRPWLRLQARQRWRRHPRAATLPRPPKHHAHGAIYRAALRPLRWVLEGLTYRGPSVAAGACTQDSGARRAGELGPRQGPSPGWGGRARFENSSRPSSPEIWSEIISGRSWRGSGVACF